MTGDDGGGREAVDLALRVMRDYADVSVRLLESERRVRDLEAQLRWLAGQPGVRGTGLEQRVRGLLAQRRPLPDGSSGGGFTLGPPGGGG